MKVETLYSTRVGRAPEQHGARARAGVRESIQHPQLTDDCSYDEYADLNVEMNILVHAGRDRGTRARVRRTMLS